jgi:hypothetical protein
MPPDRHSPPPARPPRERHAGPGFGGPRRPFGGGGFPGGGGGGPRPGFAPPPAAPHSVRLRDGDREVEASGSADFVRQLLDDLPAIFARLRGEATAPARPASIAMPAPPRSADRPAGPDAGAAPDDHPGARDSAAKNQGEGEDDEEPRRHRRLRHGAAANGHGALEDRILAVLKRADHPLSVAAIRKQLGDQSTGQQIRRILERAADRVVATSERPAAYALR